MFAIFQTGGKQYQVQKGDVIYTEKLPQQVGEDVEFDQVLMVDNTTGTPFVPSAKVIATVEKQGRQKKIEIIKFKSKKHHFKRQGHRQPYTKLVIKEIQF